MKTIREKSEEHQETALKEKGAILRVDVRNAFNAGANYVLDEIENFMKGLDKDLDFCSANEKFYKLDVIADIRLFIKQLKK